MRDIGRQSLAATAVATLIVAAGAGARASGQDSAVVRLHTVVQPRVSLRVSDSSLIIPASSPGVTAPRVAGTVSFRAAARTSDEGEVVLTVEALADLDWLGGPSRSGTAIEFSGDGAGTLGGVLEAHTPIVAGRWVSSGVREGQLTFTVRGDVGPNGVVVPLRFVLSAP